MPSGCLIPFIYCSQKHLGQRSSPSMPVCESQILPSLLILTATIIPAWCISAASFAGPDIIKSNFMAKKISKLLKIPAKIPVIILGAFAVIGILTVGAIAGYEIGIDPQITQPTIYKQLQLKNNQYHE